MPCVTDTGLITCKLFTVYFLFTCNQTSNLYYKTILFHNCVGKLIQCKAYIKRRIRNIFLPEKGGEAYVNVKRINFVDGESQNIFVQKAQ